MPLTSGSKLGPYEILSALGSGGMGEVYRARDTRLGRDVAIKVLPQHLSSNPDLKARFEREARAISALSHPHICHLYDIGSQNGTDFIVMELLEGEGLAEKLQKGAMPLKQALEVGIEIAEALEKAHKSDIVHRDLKPGNIMLTKSGAKLLDFGLAKPAKEMAAMASGSMETMSKPLTGEGKIVGTFQYMAPEQIHGENADARTDIFALGAVLYEMVTGRRAFGGTSQISVMSAILEKEPEPISNVQPLTPVALDHVIQRALAKDPEERWQSAADLKQELKWVAASGSQASAAAAPVQRRAGWRIWALVAAFIASIFALGALIFFVLKPVSPPVEVRAEIAGPEKTNFFLMNDDGSGPAVISSDGTNIAFTASDEQGRLEIWVRALSGGVPRLLNGTEGGIYPFWSPDGKWVGFFANGKLKKVDVNAGAVLEITDAPRARGGSWNKNNVILFAPSTTNPIVAVSAAGGTPTPVTTLDTSVHTTHRWPLWLSDGKRFLYLATSHGNPQANEHNGIYIGSLDNKKTRMLMPADSNVVVTPGYLLFVQAGTLMAQHFNEDRGELEGDPMPVAQDVAHNSGTWRSAFDASQNGIVVHQSGLTGQTTELLWLSPGNKASSRAVEGGGKYRDLTLSPDGTKLLVSVGEPRADLWIYDLKRSVKSRFTFTNVVLAAVWSPDGSRIAFSEVEPGGQKIHIKEAGGSGKEEEFRDTGTVLDTVTGWSRDGKYLLYSAGSGTMPLSIYTLPLTGDRKPKLFVTAQPFQVTGGHFSQDGNWVAYISSENGRREAYLTSFPEPNGKWQISSDGATEVHWFPDGKALLYERPDGVIVKVPFAAHGSTVELGAPQNYVSARPVPLPNGGAWDVAPDGRVLVNNTLGEPMHNINVIVNWTAGLKK